MANPLTNTFQTYSSKGIREDLSDLIADISPTTTPFQSNIGTREAENTYFEWQTDALATASSTPVVEGNDVGEAGYTAVTATVRLGNYCQINITHLLPPAGSLSLQISFRLLQLVSQIEYFLGLGQVLC